jgi:hypothetical protein
LAGARPFRFPESGEAPPRIVVTMRAFVPGCLLLAACAGNAPSPANVRTASSPVTGTAATTAPAAPSRDDATLELLPYGSGSISGVVVTEAGHAVAYSLRTLYDFDPATPDVVRRHALPDDTTSVVPSANGARAVVVRKDKNEIWDLATFRMVAALDTTETGNSVHISADGAQVAVSACGDAIPAPPAKGKAKPVDPEANPTCGFLVFSGRDGKRLAAFATEGDGGFGEGTFSPDGRFIVLSEMQKRLVYNASTGKLVLRRIGGRVDGSGGSELTEFMGDSLLVTRFGVVEVDDLVTGKVLAGQRYDVPGADETLFHLRIPGTTRLATMWGSGKKAFVWDWAQKRVIRTFDLGKKLEEPCYGCTLSALDANKLSVVGAPVELTLDLTTGTATSSGDASSRRTEIAFEGPGVRVERQYEDRGSACYVTAGGVRNEVSRVLCGNGEKVVGRGTLVAGSASGSVAVYDAAKKRMVLSLGPAPEERGGGLNAVVRDGILGFTSWNEDKPLWLTQGEHTPREFPKSKRGGMSMETSDLRVTSEWLDKGHMVRAEDLDGQEAFSQKLDGSNGPMLGSGARVVISKLAQDRKSYESMLCEPKKGCTPLPAGPRPVGFNGPWLASRQSAGPAHDLRNLDTGKAFTIAEEACGTVLGILPTATGAHLVCAAGAKKPPPKGAAGHGADGDEKLWVVDQDGARVRELTVPHVKLRPMSMKSLNGQLRLLGSSLVIPGGVEGGHDRYALVDVEGKRPSVDLVTTATGAIALYSDGTFERFGKSEPLLPMVRCVRGDVMSPLESCLRGREIKGGLVR